MDLHEYGDVQGEEAREDDAGSRCDPASQS